MAELESPSVMPKLITYLSSLLQRVAESNDLSGLFHPQKITVFHGLTRPSISIQSYLERIFQYANCSPSCFVVAYVYLDRFMQKQPSLPINSLNVHRLLITSVMVAAKFMDDIDSVLGGYEIEILGFLFRSFGVLYYNNAYYAKVGGITTAEMNFLEVDFLFGLGFHLNVTPATFHNYCAHLQRQMLLVEPPLNLAESSLNIGVRSQKLQLCFSEDEASHQQQQKQLAV
ncbi:hypothetical protein RHSIM_Rhsim07G0037900 [Rhododendron simsii]|uniref:Cyclin n=1 Tax=Rhododendron simsii TaxID=118357 RepID=A0A834LK46_RHOSS|nr:hypothetical protein RHSIM_Rhsim07G0037900 [Rhododendron simsii]